MNTLHILMIGASLKQNGGIASVENLILKHAPPEINIRHIVTHDEGSILHRLIIFIKALGETLVQLSSERVNVVYIHLSDGGSILRKVIIAIISFAFHKPVIMHTHGAEFPKTYERLPQWAQQYLSKIFNQCNAFIVLSESWEKFYVDNCNLIPKKVFVLNNPTEVPKSIPQRANKEGKVTAIFCGRIGQRKGAFDLIRSFAQLPTEQKQCSQLIIAGDGDLVEAQKLVENLSLKEQVTFLGWIDSAQREKLLAEADIFILPSYHEGLPMAILEAMSWGLPIVSTPIGGIPEIVITNQNGLLIPPGDVDRLTQAIQSLISTKTLRLFLGENARNSVKSFDISNYWDKLLNIFDSCLQ
jgi:glycosyltransferase involved in cell wall biosynthesis